MIDFLKLVDSGHEINERQINGMSKVYKDAYVNNRLNEDTVIMCKLKKGLSTLQKQIKDNNNLRKSILKSTKYR